MKKIIFVVAVVAVAGAAYVYMDKEGMMPSSMNHEGKEHAETQEMFGQLKSVTLDAVKNAEEKAEHMMNGMTDQADAMMDSAEEMMDDTMDAADDMTDEMAEDISETEEDMMEEMPEAPEMPKMDDVKEDAEKTMEGMM